MAELVFKERELVTLVLPNLSDGIHGISNALNYMNTMIIPNGFRYKQTLISLKDDIHRIKNSLQYNYDIIHRGTYKMVRKTDELEQLAFCLNVTKISKRVNKY